MKKELVNDWDRLESLVDEIIAKTDFQLHKIDVIEEEGNLLLQIIIDSPDGITVEDCVQVTNLINPQLDKNDDLFKTSYILDVCSKGVEK